jgi:hypothetical protein
MVKIQIDLSENEDRKVTLFKVDQNLQTKEEAIKQIINRLPLKRVSVGNMFNCKKCGKITDEFEAEKGLCKNCQKE